MIDGGAVIGATLEYNMAKFVGQTNSEDQILF
jgi:hypothetical protein